MKKNSSSDMKYRGSQLDPILEASSDEELEKGYETPDDGGGKMSVQNTPNSLDSLGSIGMGDLGIGSPELDRGGASNTKFLEERVKNRRRLFADAPAFPGEEVLDKAVEKRRIEEEKGGDNTKHKKARYDEDKRVPDSSAEGPSSKRVKRHTMDDMGL